MILKMPNSFKYCRKFVVVVTKETGNGPVPRRRFTGPVPVPPSKCVRTGGLRTCKVRRLFPLKTVSGGLRTGKFSVDVRDYAADNRNMPTETLLGGKV